MALATLTKGPVGFAVPLIVAALYLTWTRRWQDYWQKGVPLAGMLLFILLAAPWYAAMFLVHGDAYATGAKANTIGRFLSPMEGHQGTIFFYLPVILLGFFPWSALLPVPLYRTLKDWYLIRRARYSSRSRTGTSELDLFAALWVVGVFVFFTASATRLPHYIGPLFPAAALLTASYWSRCLQDPTTKGIRGSIHLMMGLGYLLAIGFACLPTLYTTYASKMVREFPLAGQVDLGSGPYLVATLLLLGMTLVGYLGLNDERRGGAFWAAGGDLSWSGSDRHRDRDSAHQSICGRAPAGTRLCRGTESGSPGSIHCLWHHETVVRILRETQDTLRTHWGRGQDTDGTERAKESDDPIAGERTIEVAGGSKRAGPHSQTLRLRAAGQPADGDDSRRCNPATSTQHSRPLSGLSGLIGLSGSIRSNQIN